jgi:hypothetical protein
MASAEPVTAEAVALQHWMASAPARECEAFAGALMYALAGIDAGAGIPSMGAMREPPPVPDPQPLTDPELRDWARHGAALPESALERLRPAVRGFSPKRTKGGVEQWLFYYFLDTPQQILPGLWLGACGRGGVACTGAQDEPLLRTLGVTRVLCLGDMSRLGDYRQHAGVSYRILPDIEDDSEQDILRFFKQGTAYIQESMAQQGQGQGQGQLARCGEHTLVHCMAGVSRSATMVAAFLIKYLGLDVAAALAVVRAARPIADPNEGFQRQLHVWWASLRRCSAATGAGGVAAGVVGVGGAGAGGAGAGGAGAGAGTELGSTSKL